MRAGQQLLAILGSSGEGRGCTGHGRQDPKVYGEERWVSDSEGGTELLSISFYKYGPGLSIGVGHSDLTMIRRTQ